MTTPEGTDYAAAMGSAWEQYKQVNDNRLNDIERKGYADPLYDEHLHNINEAMNNYRSRMEQAEIVNSRPALGGENESFKASEKNGAYSKAFRNYLRKGMDAGLEALQTKALSVGSDPDGGYLVMPTGSISSGVPIGIVALRGTAGYRPVVYP